MDQSPKTIPDSQVSSQTSPTRYSKATHLTEFYPYLNKTHQPAPLTQRLEESFAPAHSRKQSFSTTNSYTSISPSTYDFSSLVTKTDLSQTMETYSEIFRASEQYRKALMTVAEAAGTFGAALEKGAKCKGSGTAADGLLSAGGMFFLVANHQQILAHSIKESFEEPVTKEIASFKTRTLANDEQFKVNIKDRVRDLKRQERENAKLSRSKTRNLVTYRSKLQQLTSQIDEIDKLKHDYYQSSFDLVQETSNKVLKNVGSIVRAQVEIYEGIARKGWSGGGLDELISQCPDPFSPEEDEEVEEDQEADDTLEEIPRQPQLRTGSNGLTLNRELSAPQPTLSHQQSIRTMLTIPGSLESSTPIRSKPQEGVNNARGANDSFDDNSFSLPLPGSSRVITLAITRDGGNILEEETGEGTSGEDVQEDGENVLNGVGDVDGEEPQNENGDVDGREEDHNDERHEKHDGQFPAHNEWNSDRSVEE